MLITSISVDGVAESFSFHQLLTDCLPIASGRHSGERRNDDP
jgi:hypothetical protein